MQQLGLNGGVGAHRERQRPVWPSQPSGTLDQVHPAGTQTHERPPRHALFSRGSRRFLGRHLQLSIQIVGHDRRQEPALIGRESLARDVVHLSLGFELGKDRLLSARGRLANSTSPSSSSRPACRRSRDPDDDHVLACALEAKPISSSPGDADLLKSYQDIPIVSAAEALRRVEAQK